MFYRLLFVSALIALFAGIARGQTIPPNRSQSVAEGWRPAGEVGAPTPAVRPASAVQPASATVPVTPPGVPLMAVAPAAAPATPTPPLTAANGADPTRRPITKVTSGNGALPNEHGQVWREYDISPYTLRVTATERPEQAIIDWILRETGYEAWHGEPLGVLSATKRSLRVYHTPDMQAVVAELIDRFIASEAETFAFGVRVITLDQPNWRTRAQRFLKPVNVQTPGIERVADGPRRGFGPAWPSCRSEPTSASTARRTCW